MAKTDDRRSKTQSNMPEVSPSEARVLKFLAGKVGVQKSLSETEILPDGMNEREVSSAISWLDKKELLLVERKEHLSYALTDEGKRFLETGLPEEMAFKLAAKNGDIPTAELIEELGGKDGKIAIAQLARLGIKPSGGVVSVKGKDSLKDIFRKRTLFLSGLPQSAASDPELLDHFRKREDIISEKKRMERIVTLTDAGLKLSGQVSTEDQVSEITPDLLKNGTWRGRDFRRYDLNALVERINSAVFHPITFLKDRVRRIFLEMGFTEMTGHYVEYAGWNMDALFIPQDHPARDMQDTFYIDADREIPFEDKEVLKIFQEAHEKGVEEYSGWGYHWDVEKAKQLVLRTHTTVSTIHYLYKHKDAPQAAFSVEKVFRHESVDWKHLAELHQIEGTYYAKDASLSTLFWLMKEFYGRLGFHDLKFIPSYYPYTEPSLDVVVKINGKEMELGGSGVFRPEVTRPLGLKEPVVAWGLGLERLAMIYYGLDDIRDIYRTDIDWLRKFPLKF